jgi:deoxyribose-phosphate aldolase
MYTFSLISGIPFKTVSEDLDRIMANEPEVPGRREDLRQVFGLMDFTSLDGSDNAAKITALCEKAVSFGEQGLPFPAAVCIYPPFIAVARQALKGTPIRVAVTAAAFPHGQMPLQVKLEEIRYAVNEGADEIDVVISRGTFLGKDYHQVYRELDAMRDLAKHNTLKVILETGELGTPENIARAGEIAIEAGADFIKTSTGKITPAATPEAVYVMLLVIREYHRQTGKKIGIKPAGGIADPGVALHYHYLVRQILGEAWLTPELFRIGASRLAGNIADIILKPL